MPPYYLRDVARPEHTAESRPPYRSIGASAKGPAAEVPNETRATAVARETNVQRSTPRPREHLAMILDESRPCGRTTVLSAPGRRAADLAEQSMHELRGTPPRYRALPAGCSAQTQEECWRVPRLVPRLRSAVNDSHSALPAIGRNRRGLRSLISKRDAHQRMLDCASAGAEINILFVALG